MSKKDRKKKIFERIDARRAQRDETTRLLEERIAYWTKKAQEREAS
jgi:hypothetical protein